MYKIVTFQEIYSQSKFRFQNAWWLKSGWGYAKRQDKSYSRLFKQHEFVGITQSK